MPYSLDELKVLLRQRIGEPESGTFTAATTYSDPASTRDELRDYINRAQKKVAEDTIGQGHALLTGRRKLMVEPNVYEYSLPSDFISVLNLSHFHQDIFHRLTQHPLSHLQNNFNPLSTASVYTHYDVYGQTASVIAEGTSMEESVTGVALYDRLGTFTTDGITVNVDQLYNLTDDSIGTITAITDATRLAIAGGMTGGKTNSIQTGDRYQVQSGSEYLQILHTYPPVSAGQIETTVDETLSTTTTSQFATFTTGDQGQQVLYAIDCFLTSDDKPSYICKLTDDEGTGPSDPDHDIARASIPSPIDQTQGHTITTGAYNQAIFEYGITLTANTTYRVFLFDDDAANIPFISTGNFTKFKVRAYTGMEYLDMYYAKYPKLYDANFTGNTEVPDYGVEALLTYAEMMCYQKMYGGRSAMSREAQADYEIQIQRVKSQAGLRNQNRTTVVGDVIAGIHSRTPSFKNVPITTKLPLG